MGTRIIATGADWSGKGKPNISPFISISDADFAYDFRPRVSKYNDLTKKTALALMRGALSAGNASIAFNADDTVGLVSADGFGLTLDNLGAAFISHTPKPLAIDGSLKLTAYVVGGYSGLAFPAGSQYTGSPGSTPSICNLFDYGSRVNPGFGFSLQRAGIADATTVAFGGRINSGAINVGGQNLAGATTKKCAIFLTFDGVNIKVYNATTNFEQTVTAASLGITAALPISNAIRPGVAFGTTGSISNAALAPTIYQIAQWGRVLSKPEMVDQYNKTIAAFPEVGL
ncbi:Uncharacterised protein [Klebsiella pneumoniae]|uniref:hypothetical protein n=1 Tax=Klebsiella pneumoniae TaxID=573 RepID=UPI000DE5E4AE|nr:hypothetical protein [Klebsiella pneumoniae]SSN92796.1 Uncharacterised protein [Klebsiella pneumoniae]